MCGVRESAPAVVTNHILLEDDRVAELWTF